LNSRWGIGWHRVATQSVEPGVRAAYEREHVLVGRLQELEYKTFTVNALSVVELCWQIRFVLTVLLTDVTQGIF
jgi:hypothetical protein